MNNFPRTTIEARKLIGLNIGASSDNTIRFVIRDVGEYSTLNLKMSLSIATRIHPKF